MDELHPLVEGLVAFTLLVGAAFIAVGALGLARFSDFYMRLHAPTKASTLGVGGVLVASMIWHWAAGEWAARELLITLFMFLTAPVSAHLLALAALHLDVPSKAKPPETIDRR